MKEKKKLWTGIGLLGAFALWTLLVRYVDVQAVGPNSTSVGFAALNVWLHRLTGIHMTLYTVTDWLGLVPIAVCLCFGGLGLAQLLKRRSLRRVDADLLLLGAYYLLVIVCYLVFEMIPVNFRPVLIDGRLEASYPSSTTLLVLGVMPTLLSEVRRRAPKFESAAAVFAVGFSAFMLVGRFASGVHWATDIAGSVLLAAGLFSLYQAAALRAERKHNGVL